MTTDIPGIGPDDSPYTIDPSVNDFRPKVYDAEKHWLHAPYLLDDQELIVNRDISQSALTNIHGFQVRGQTSQVGPLIGELLHSMLPAALTHDGHDWAYGGRRVFAITLREVIVDIVRNTVGPDALTDAIIDAALRRLKARRYKKEGTQ